MIINSPLTWNTHYDYSRGGLGQDISTSTDPFSAAVSNIGLSVSTWGGAEWGLLLLGGFALVSMMYLTGEGIGRVSGFMGKRQAKRRRKAQLRAEYASL